MKDVSSFVNEVLFLEMRIFNEFLQKHGMQPSKANRLFENNGLWKFIEDNYDVLQMNGDEYVLDDVEYILRKKGVLA
ncbi:MAG: DUF3791 domain-containing protein [Clostridia bacterium]|nr:DUF3791 domain-containing protein [Clostridia bacterium]